MILHVVMSPARRPLRDPANPDRYLAFSDRKVADRWAGDWDKRCKKLKLDTGHSVQTVEAWEMAAG